MPLGINSVAGPTSAIPEEDSTTSHVHLTFNSIVDAYHHPVPAGVGNKAQ